MKKSKIIIECILLGLIVLVSTLLIIKPYVLALDQKEEKAPEVKEEVPEEEIGKGKALLGVNVLVEGQGLSFDAKNNILTINKKGEYELVGNFANGKIVIDTLDDVKLIFQGVNIISEDKILIENKNNSNLVIELMAGSYNTLETKNGSNILSNNLLIEGNGTLSIINQNGNGINSKNVTINNGNLYIFASSQAITTNLTINKGNIILFSNEPLTKIASISQPIMQVTLKTPLNQDDVITLIDENNNEFIKGNTLGSVNTFLISGPYLKNGNYFILRNESKISLNNSEVFVINDIINNFAEK